MAPIQEKLLDALLSILLQMSHAVRDPRPRAHVAEMGIALLCAAKPKTITSGLSWLNQQQQDWSRAYHLFSQVQWRTEDLFRPILHGCLRFCPDPAEPIFSACDDSLFRKSGKKIPGTTYGRDPQSPPFQVNLVLGQRFLQTSLLVRTDSQRPFRSIPVSFVHVPPLKAPPRASAEEKKQVQEARKKYNLSVEGISYLYRLRQELDQAGCSQRVLIQSVDGGFANRTYLRQLPHNTVVVARGRKNAALRAPLHPLLRKGTRKYGDVLPSPEQYRQNEAIPWQSMHLFIAGQMREVHYKEITPICWPKVTGDQPIRLIILKPAGYRLRKGSKLLYRNPAYLFCTSLTATVRDIITAYIGRWEIEVNFRDEKSGLGVGQAQVWNPKAIHREPAFLVACYSALLLASLSAYHDERHPEAFGPLPAWRRDCPLRPSLFELLKLLRVLAIPRGKPAAAA